jgi:hypothetical protein
MFCIGNGQEQLIVKGHYTLGTQLEVYDAKLHAIPEAPLAIPHIDILATAIYICIDNTRQLKHFGSINITLNMPDKLLKQLAYF